VRDHLTLFCCPKPFRGHVGNIQRNAISSWLHLNPPPQVILFGHEEGIAEVARDLGIPHLTSLACTPQGTPRLDSVFTSAQAHARTPWLGYINADILLLDDFASAFQLFQREMDRSRQARALLSSQRVDILLHNVIDFGNAVWQSEIRQLVEETGALMNKDAIDLFLFNRGLYQDLLPLALGRIGFDTYLVWEAREQGAAIVDASDAFLLVHQCHDYAHTDGWENLWKGQESKQNLKLMNGRVLSISNGATHLLDKRGLRSGKPKNRFDPGKLAIQRVRAGLAELERGNLDSAKDFFEDSVLRIQTLDRVRNQIERRRLVNRVKRLTAKVLKLVGIR
jgi:hypothetical protein